MQFGEAALQRVREDRLLIDQLDRWLYDEISPFLGQRVLEIGCGLGNFARHFTGRSLYIGADPSAESIAAIRETYRGYANMQAHVADATSPDFLEYGRYHLDTVFSLNVFEHIADDETAARNAAQVLQPGGVLVLVVPAHAWLYGSMDRAIGHHRRYTRTSASALFRQAALVPVTLKYTNAFGALGWFFNGRIRRQTTPPAGQLRLFNRLVPWLSRLERLVPPPFGISLIAVGRKDEPK